MKRFSDEEISNMYSYLFSHAYPDTKGVYGFAMHRAGFFVKWIIANVKPGSTILEVGCGRGQLIRWLQAKGYEVEGTEVADWLMKPGGDLYGLPVKKMFFSELNQIPENHYDVVLSNDVIEHLQFDEEVIDGMMNLARISKGPVLISTGGTRHGWQPVIKPSNLHFVMHPKEWWKEVYERYCIIDQEFESGSYFIFGRKK